MHIANSVYELALKRELDEKVTCLKQLGHDHANALRKLLDWEDAAFGGASDELGLWRLEASEVERFQRDYILTSLRNEFQALALAFDKNRKRGISERRISEGGSGVLVASRELHKCSPVAPCLHADLHSGQEARQIITGPVLALQA